MTPRNQHTTLVLAFADGSHGTVQFGSQHPDRAALRVHLSSPFIAKAWVIYGRIVQTYGEVELRAMRQRGIGPHLKDRPL